MSSSLVHFQVYSGNVSFEACLNDIPIVSLAESPAGYDQSIPVNQYVIPEYNRVDLWVDIAGKPSECRRPHKKTPPKDARAIVRIVRYPNGRVEPSAEEILLMLEWEAHRDPEGTVYPLNVGANLDMGKGLGSWSWQSAPPLLLTDVVVEEARVLLEAMRQAIRSGEVSRVLELLRINFDEVKKAYSVTDDSLSMAGLAAFIGRYAAEPDRVLPIEPSKFDLRLVAGGRMIETLNEDWLTSLCLRQAMTDQDGAPAGEAILPYSLLLARVGDVLRIVR